MYSVKHAAAVAASLVLSGALTIFSAQARTPEEWKDGAYAYSAQNTSLETVLNDFANSHAVQLRMGEMTGAERVSGRLRSSSAEAFLNRLALEHRFQWFVYNNTLYVSPMSKQESRRLKLSKDGASGLKQALEGIGLLEPRFGWGEIPEQDAVLVTGPAEYVSLISQFSENEKQNKADKELMVFPLKYASVSDRQIRYRDKTLLVPGVTTILNELLGQQNPKSASGVQQQESSNGNPMMDSFMEQNDSILADLARRTMKPNSGLLKEESDDFKPMVSADVRNNVLLIRDDPARRNVYQALISQIDIPNKLIEINALIVDVDRSELSRLSANLLGSFGNVTAGSSMLGGSSTLFVTDFQRFFGQIQALEGKGNASVIANPSVLTLENQPAVLDFSETAYLQSIGERVAEVTPITAGTTLQVVPRALTNKDRVSIQLTVDVEDGKLSRDLEGEPEGTRQAKVSTQALVEEKNTLVMGGFSSRETGDRVRRIPILGSIPFIGKFFSSTSQVTSNRERLFIISPHLIGDQVDPSRYVDPEFRGQIADSVQEMQRRQKFSAMKGPLERAMRDLAQNQVPQGFSSGGEGRGLINLCGIVPGLTVDASRNQWYSKGALQISVGVIRNVTAKPQRFDESLCRGGGVLAVAAWPTTQLAPGQSAEVYVAYEIHAGLRRSRQSLLTP